MPSIQTELLLLQERAEATGSSETRTGQAETAQMSLPRFPAEQWKGFRHKLGRRRPRTVRGWPYE